MSKKSYPKVMNKPKDSILEASGSLFLPLWKWVHMNRKRGLNIREGLAYGTFWI
jgi:hypothetical protein